MVLVMQVLKRKYILICSLAENLIVKISSVSVVVRVVFNLFQNLAGLYVFILNFYNSKHRLSFLKKEKKLRD